MDEKLILEKIRSVRHRLNIQKYFQTFATFPLLRIFGVYPLSYC